MGRSFSPPPPPPPPPPAGTRDVNPAAADDPDNMTEVDDPAEAADNPADGPDTPPAEEEEDPDSPAEEGMTSSSTSRCSVRFNRIPSKIEHKNADERRKQLRRGIGRGRRRRGRNEEEMAGT